ncbi:MAG: penicillin-binding protein [Bacilli bacterium]|nr:penicillin-binding protein [Bacilli bacterium]
MKKGRTQEESWKFPKMVFKVFLFFVVLLFMQLIYLSLSPNIYGTNMDAFAKSRNTVKQTLPAARGNIYDKDDNVLALNVTSYTVIAYLSESRTGSSKTALHVVDKKKTAEVLSPILNMEVSKLEALLNKKVYQVELGPGGRGITELKKAEIEALQLPGITFVESHKRYYPNGDFASYMIGYAKEKEVDSEKSTAGTTKSVKTTDITGELGIELKYNDLLKGKDGYLEFQKDRFGYKIPDTKEKRVDAEDGNDVYLTLDSNIQRFVETAVKEATVASQPEWMVLSVMDAKTGKILGSANSPTFDPNKKNMTSYQDPLVSYTYEPGSTMKIYSYLCAINKGTYKGEDTYDSSKIDFTDDTIRDWNKVGFGTISFDKGFEYSSNVGASNLMQRFIGKEDLNTCLNNFGFGKQTGIELPSEQSGKVSFRYPIEIASAAFGQGITTTAVQQLQALTLLANDGKMLTPHIVDKIINKKTGEVVYKSKKIATKALVSTSAVNKVKDLMYNVVNSADGYATGKPYKIDEYNIIGKTGTAQYVNARTGKYVAGSYIYSFSGMYPKDNPEIIVYAALAKPATNSNYTMQVAVRNVMSNIATYKNMFHKQTEETKNSSIGITSYSNKNTETVKHMLEEKGVTVITLGNGDKITNQYPANGTKITKTEKVLLKTNDSNVTMPNMVGWSRSTASAYLSLLDITPRINGYGFVTSQSIGVGTPLTKETDITLELNQKYQLQ